MKISKTAFWEQSFRGIQVEGTLWRFSEWCKWWW